MTTTILLADDDEMIVDVLQHQLRKEGFDVLVAYDGETALGLARNGNPDLVLLDVMMPRLQGFEVCREIRRQSAVPILMLTARGEELDRIVGLDMGADDYIVKPFSFRELMARIRANLRRMTLLAPPEPQAAPPQAADKQAADKQAADKQAADKQAGEGVQIGPIRIDRRRHLVTRNGAAVKLSQREYDLLLALYDASGALLSRSQLLDLVWGKEWIGDPRTLDVHIRWLREKLEDQPASPRLLLTVRGTGYRLVTADELTP